MRPPIGPLTQLRVDRSDEYYLTVDYESAFNSEAIHIRTRMKEHTIVSQYQIVTFLCFVTAFLNYTVIQENVTTTEQRSHDS